MIKDKLTELLYEALSSSGTIRTKAIKKFQDLIWNDTSIDDENLNNLLTDAAYILDFYEPNEDWRKENPCYYGDDHLELELKSILEKLTNI